MRDGNEENLKSSLAFWLCLLLSVFLYAVVFLAPKIDRWTRRCEEFEVNQQQLVDLREQIEFGENLVRELESNPTFRSATISASTRKTGHRGVISVDEELRFHGRESFSNRPATRSASSWGLRAIRHVASSSLLKFVGLVTSAGLLIAAFTCLIERRTTRQADKRRE